MILRIGATVGALLPVAAGAMMTDRGSKVTTATPDVWHVLGYPFEAGSMIAALCACAAVRFWAVQKDHQKARLTLDAPVSLLALMFTAAAVIRLRPDPALALVYGTTFGILGAGMIAIVKKNADRVLSAFGLTAAEADKPEPPATG